jgi:iron complex outermembrane recepter protein
MTKTFTTIFASVLLFLNATAQNVNLNFKVQSKNGEKLEGASFELKRLVDSVTIYNKLTDSNGAVLVQVPLQNKYIATVTYVGFEKFVRVIAVANDNINIQISLKPKASDQNVIVTAKKPLITQEDDKTIVDPENIAQNSTNAFEVMESVPGVFVDQDGNFYLGSTTPANVQINGRDMRMGATDLATLIKSLPPNAIQKIEILRTPSAKYDASSSGGLINIVLRKGVKLGLTGSVYLGLNQGQYGNQYIGASIAQGTGKKTIYANINIGRRTNFDELNSYRNFNVDSVLNQQSANLTNGQNANLNFGGSYSFTKWDVGYDANVSYNQQENTSNNLNRINGKQSNNLVANNNDVANSGHNFLIGQTLSAKYKADSGKIEWNSSLSHNVYNYNNNQDYETVFNIPVVAGIVGNGKQNSNRNLLIAQTDFIWKPIKKFTIETGAKTNWLVYNNDAVFFKNNTPDARRSNGFEYTESITSAYLQAAKTIEKLVLKTGVRMEHTNMQGTQLVPNTQKFTIKRTDFFPYAYLSRPIFTIMKYDLNAYLVYRKSISRPGYELLNPFSKFVDNYLSEVGNPNLQPQFTETYEANISFEDQPVLAFGQNRTKGIFTNVIYQNPNNPSEALRTYDNLGNNTENFFRFTIAVPPGGKYFGVVGGQRNFNTYKGLYQGSPLEFSNKSWNIYTYHQLKIDKLSTFTLQGWMQLGGLYQFYELNNFGQLNASINRQFLKRKLLITVNARDILYTNKTIFKLAQGNVLANGNRVSDSRRFGINIRYNFGIKKREETANPEDKTQ